MKSLSEDIKDMLENTESSESSGEFSFFPIYVGKEPAEPSQTITLFETPGFAPQLTMDRNEKYEYPSLQIRIRSNKFQDGWEQAEKIKDSLHGRANETWDETYYSLIRCSNGPYLLDYDKNQRVRFIINFDCQRR
jgi:hypothetical protein